VKELERRLEEASVRARSQKWGDKGDFYEKEEHKRKRKKLQKKGRK